MLISKEQANKHGIKILDSNNNLSTEKHKKIQEIKALLPNLVNADNKLNLNTLEELLGLTETTYKNQGYELTFAGKALAKAKADAETKFELKLEKEQSKNLDTTENVVIKGDNIDVLKILKQNYQGKIKMIYIDPPYNTGNDGFVYNDNFKQNEETLIEEFKLSEESIDYLNDLYKTKTHSGWLAFMYPRLKLARDLLKEDGVIFISIDDNEQANLKILCDEIFGEENFVTTFLWEKSSSNLSNFFKNNYDYVLCYIKDKTSFKYKFIGKISEGMGDSSLLNGEANKYSRLIFPKKTINFPSIDNSILKQFKDNDLELENDITIVDNYNENEVIINAHFKWTQERLYEEIDKGTSLISKTNKLRIRYQRTNFGDIIIPYKSITRNDNVSLKNNHDTVGFSHPKPVSLISYLCKMIHCKESDIVLDFFAGSGTTGHAVMDLNKEDGGNRKFILVQWNEDLAKYKKHKQGDYEVDSTGNKVLDNNQSEAYKFCIDNNLQPVISSITIERLNRAGEKLKAENNTLDIGYKVFSLKEKINIINNNNQYQLANLYTTDLDILYNMLAKTDVMLHEKIEKVSNKVSNNIYKVENKYYLTANITEEENKIIEKELENITELFINGFSDINLENLLNILSINRFNKDKVKIIY